MLLSIVRCSFMDKLDFSIEFAIIDWISLITLSLRHFLFYFPLCLFFVVTYFCRDNSRWLSDIYVHIVGDALLFFSIVPLAEYLYTALRRTRCCFPKTKGRQPSILHWYSTIWKKVFYQKKDRRIILSLGIFGFPNIRVPSYTSTQPKTCIKSFSTDLSHLKVRRIDVNMIILKVLDPWVSLTDS